MSDYGITPEGFNRKRLDQLLLELNAQVKTVFGDNFNVSPESSDGQINGIISESNASLWELAENAYNAFNPSAATGANLSNLVQLNGLTRLPATFSRVDLSFTGTPGVIILAGSIVSTSDTGDQFETQNNITIDGTGNASDHALAIDQGPIGATAGTVTQINTPISGWDTVTNLTNAVEGTYEETDPELRARRERSVSRDAQAVIDAIYSTVANVSGVSQLVVLENDTNVVDANGLPPHSFEVVVVGGSDEDIGKAIWLKKPAGILSSGLDSTVILDSQGLPHTIGFSRPVTVDIYVEVDLVTDATYPANGDDLIKQAIVDYANGDLIEGQGFGLGEDVTYTRLYTPINSVYGHQINALRISTITPPLLEVNIPILANNVSNFTTANIVINQI